MKFYLQIILAVILSFFQLVIVPINFSLLAILLIMSSNRFQQFIVLLVTSSLLLSVFGNLVFGLVLISFSLSALFFLIIKRYFPDRLLINLILIAVSLIFWEIVMKFEINFFQSII